MYSYQTQSCTNEMSFEIKHTLSINFSGSNWENLKHIEFEGLSQFTHRAY